jgi:hypothetical protein
MAIKKAINRSFDAAMASPVSLILLLDRGSHLGFRAGRQHTTDRFRTQCSGLVLIVFHALCSERRSRRPTFCNQDPKCRKEQSSNRLPTYLSSPAVVSSKFTPKTICVSPSGLPTHRRA